MHVAQDGTTFKTVVTNFVWYSKFDPLQARTEIQTSTNFRANKLSIYILILCFKCSDIIYFETETNYNTSFSQCSKSYLIEHQHLRDNKILYTAHKLLQFSQSIN